MPSKYTKNIIRGHMRWGVAIIKNVDSGNVFIVETWDGRKYPGLSDVLHFLVQTLGLGEKN